MPYLGRGGGHTPSIWDSPFWWFFIAIGMYAATYFAYSKWYDKKVWRTAADRTTPAHMYMDGVEFFPVSRYVLWGTQFKGIAALGPILGPFIAMQFGWLPALLWLVFGNIFIGWMHDYGSIMMSVRNEGKSMGPISYQLASPRGRTVLLTFILFYLIIISAVFIFLIALFFKIFPGTFIATVLIFGGAFVVGQMLFKVRMNIFAVTGLAIAIVIISIAIGALVGWPPKDNPGTAVDESAVFGPWTVAVFGLLVMIILAIGALAPMPTFAQPAVYVAFFPAFIAVLFIVIGTLLTPIWPAVGAGEAIVMQQPAWKGFWSGAGPLWPILFVAISCGAISGWHSLVSTSATSKQLDVETDARPVGAGAMLSEGLLGTASLAAFMVVPGLTVASSSVGGWVQGSVILTQNWLAWLGLPNLLVFFSLTLVIYALSVQILVTRFWRMVAAELFVSGIARPFGNRYVATAIGLLIPWGFAITGSWWNLWIYFGGSNQLLAGLALMLISIHLVRSRTLSKPTLVTGTFMTVTTLSALIYEAYIFFRAVTTFLATGSVADLQTRPPLNQWPSVAFAFNLAFIFVGAVLFAVGLYMAYLVYKSYWRSYKEVTAPAPAVAANGGGEEKE